MKTISAYTNEASTAGHKVGVGYYRLTKEMKEFLETVNKNEKIIGFEWTPGENEFGIIIEEKK